MLEIASMDLYDKAYFAALKKRVKAVDKNPILIGFIYLIISTIFFFVWSNIFFTISIPLLILLPLALLIPFILLYAVTKKENSKSLLIVIGIMSYTFYFELFDLVYYYQIYINEALIMESDVCPICEIEDSICLLTISLLAIVLITKSKLMTTKFNLSKRDISLAILLPLSLLLLKIALLLIF